MGWYEGPIMWFISMVLNVSVSLAMYSLVLFYHLFATELAPHKPLAKILCIKGVVFFSFWQVGIYASLWLLSCFAARMLKTGMQVNMDKRFVQK